MPTCPPLLPPCPQTAFNACVSLLQTPTLGAGDVTQAPLNLPLNLNREGDGDFINRTSSEMLCFKSPLEMFRFSCFYEHFSVTLMA